MGGVRYHSIDGSVVHKGIDIIKDLLCFPFNLQLLTSIFSPLASDRSKQHVFSRVIYSIGTLLSINNNVCPLPNLNASFIID